MDHKFQYDGQDIVYRSGSVLDREARKIVLRKLYNLCGGREHITEQEQETMFDYANHVTHTSAFDAPWRCDPGDTPEKIYERYSLWRDTDGDTYDLFWSALLASRETEKKSG